jgi:hypothetical protein
MPYDERLLCLLYTISTHRRRLHTMNAVLMNIHLPTRGDQLELSQRLRVNMLLSAISPGVCIDSSLDTISISHRHIADSCFLVSSIYMLSFNHDAVYLDVGLSVDPATMLFIWMSDSTLIQRRCYLS